MEKGDMVLFLIQYLTCVGEHRRVPSSKALGLSSTSSTVHQLPPAGPPTVTWGPASPTDGPYLPDIRVRRDEVVTMS